MLEQYYDVEWLKVYSQKIHYFGLGFIQLKLDDRRRLHFYTSELPAIVNEEDVHNHRYDFNSFVVRGSLENSIFEIDRECNQEKTHIWQPVTCSPEGFPEGYSCPLAPTEVTISLTAKFVMSAGSCYWLSRQTFHRVKGVECVTFLKRSRPMSPWAEVIREKSAPAICPFSKKVPEDQLWDIVKRMLK